MTKMARMWLDHLVKRLVGLGYGVIRINVVIESAIVINVILFGFGPFSLGIRPGHGAGVSEQS